MRKILVAIVCISLSACFKQAEPVTTELAPIQSEPLPPADPTPPITPTWVAPTNTVEAEQQYRGRYVEQGKPNNWLEVDGAGNISHYSDTTALRQMPNGQWITVAAVCTYTGHSIHAQARTDGKWTMWFTLSSASHTADQSANDCEKQPTQAGVTEVNTHVRFIDELCVGLTFDSSTGEKVYCKE